MQRSRRQAHLYIHMYRYVFIHACMYACLYTHTHTHIYIYTHTYIYIYIYTYIHIYIQILALTLLHIHTLTGGPLPLLCSRAHAGVVLPHPPRTLPHSDTHSLLQDCDGRLLSLSPSLSLTRCWGAGSSSLADVERRKKER